MTTILDVTQEVASSYYGKMGAAIGAGLAAIGAGIGIGRIGGISSIVGIVVITIF